jgi:hypothetical protein
MTRSELEMNDLFSSFSAEEQLLLCCARVEPGRAAWEEIHTFFQRSNDWKTIAENHIDPFVKTLISSIKENI